MTQQDYEQKKRECWEEYWKPRKAYRHGDAAEMVHYDAFSYAFDRAYAIGKQERDAEETAISGWVARDDGERWHERELHLFTRNKPERRKLMGDWIGRPSLTLDSGLFPDLTWKDDPIEVELIIKRKNK